MKSALLDGGHPGPGGPHRPAEAGPVPERLSATGWGGSRRTRRATSVDGGIKPALGAGPAPGRPKCPPCHDMPQPSLLDLATANARGWLSGKAAEQPPPTGPAQMSVVGGNLLLTYKPRRVRVRGSSSEA